MKEWVVETHTGNSYSEDRELGASSTGSNLATYCSWLVCRGSVAAPSTSWNPAAGSSSARPGCSYIENGLELKDDIGSEVTFFGLSLSARIAREMTSAKTRAALRRKKAEGSNWADRPVPIRP